MDDVKKFYTALKKTPQELTAALARQERRSDTSGGHDCGTLNEGRCLRLYALRGHGLCGHVPTDTYDAVWGHGY